MTGIGEVHDADVSVVLACYTSDRLESIRAALASVRKQSLEARQIVVAVDNNARLASRLHNEFDWATVVLNHGARGSSATRNRGVDAVSTTLTAFIDDDEVADPDWLLELAQPFREPDVVGTGGRYDAVWSSGKPFWFPDEFTWAVGGAYLGMPSELTEVRNVWSGNMAVRTTVFREVGGFRTEFGKHDAVSHPEDTDLCIRMSALSGGRWIYSPSAIIKHEVPPNRASLRFFVARCFAEGGGKALMSQRLGPAATLELEIRYAKRAVRSARKRLVSLRPAPVLQGIAILLGLASAGAGFLRRQMAAAVSGRHDSDVQCQIR
jgi:cellulose synthase/poly-beta-1,6-N-acetylglucosamine synthase-like glycosyltransferase